MPRRRRQEGTSLIPSNLHVPEDCRAVSEVLARVGDKWTVLVVSTLGGGPKRFNEMRRALGSIRSEERRVGKECSSAKAQSRHTKKAQSRRNGSRHERHSTRA